MQEKTLKARPGMPVLLLGILGYLTAIGLIILGGIMLEAGRGIGTLPLVVGIIWLIVGIFPFIGLRVLGPNEALVLTLFGQYTGTLREPGFYFVHPFSTSVNPAAKTRLGQSGDVIERKSGFTLSSDGAKVDMDAPGKKISLKVMTLQSRGNGHRGDVAGGGHRQGGV